MEVLLNGVYGCSVIGTVINLYVLNGNPYSPSFFLLTTG